MSDDSLQARRTVLRIAIAYLLSWLGLLLAIIFLSPFLAMASWPDVLSLLMVRQAADHLMLLSVVVVPASVFFHTRLCRRGNGRCTPHCATGAAIAAASLLLLIAADWNLGIDLQPIYLAIPVLPALLAAAIGGASSAVVWRFAVRPLRSEQEDLFRTFE